MLYVSKQSKLEISMNQKRNMTINFAEIIHIFSFKNIKVSSRHHSPVVCSVGCGKWGNKLAKFQNIKQQQQLSQSNFLHP